MNKIQFICPIIVVSNIEKSRKFYEEILCQRIIFDHGENIIFDHFSIHLKNHYQNLIDGKEIKDNCNNFELYFECDEIETIVAQLKEHNVQLIHNIREQNWKQRVVRFYDPDNNIIEVGEPMEEVAMRLHKEGYSVFDISKMIQMSEVFVKQSIKQRNK